MGKTQRPILTTSPSHPQTWGVSIAPHCLLLAYSSELPALCKPSLFEAQIVHKPLVDQEGKVQRGVAGCGATGPEELPGHRQMEGGVLMNPLACTAPATADISRVHIQSFPRSSLKSSPKLKTGFVVLWGTIHSQP